jgi:hypothetical protein
VNKFFQWLLEIPAEPVQPPAQAAMVPRPPILQPTASAEQLRFAEWRSAHIQRWLDDPGNKESPHRNHLVAERDMYLSMLQLAKE